MRASDDAPLLIRKGRTAFKGELRPGPRGAGQLQHRAERATCGLEFRLASPSLIGRYSWWCWRGHLLYGGGESSFSVRY